jgi:threonyl-tRNA synthetase
MKVKIKEYKKMQDPYILILGDNEAAEKTVSINMRGSNKQINNVPLDKFVEACVKMNTEHSLELIEEM